MEPLTPLFERNPPDPGSLPAPLAELYGGGLELGEDLVYANFVVSLDGTVTLGGLGGAPAKISGRSEADRFIMGLLRAEADCVLIGAETLRQGPGKPWTAAQIHPAAADRYATLGRPEPDLAVVTASGQLGPRASSLGERGIVLTSRHGAEALRGSGLRTQVVGEEAPLQPRAVVDALRAQGWRRILVEAGPRLTTQMIRDGVLDELFLTLSPILAGRINGDHRYGLTEGLHLLPETTLASTLVDVRAHGSHLFLRYALPA
jgi:riboflavin biosynthesis pyrimidine reductase